MTRTLKNTGTSKTTKASPAAKHGAPAKALKAQPSPKAAAKPAPKQARTASLPKPADSKQSQLITLMKSPSGATIEQMTALTGWLPHTVRGAISGVLRKRLGLNVASVAIDGGLRVYRITEPAA